jgi:hypothetical protein
MNDLKQQHRNSSNSLSPPLPDRGSPGVHTSSAEVLETGSPGTTIWDLFYSAIRIGSIDRQKLSRVAAICKRDSINPKQIISEFEK